MGLGGWLKREAKAAAVKKGASYVDTPEEARAIADRLVEGEMSDGMKAWVHSLLAGAIGSAVGAIAQMVADPAVLFAPGGWKSIVAAGLAAALVAVAGLLKQSPLPPKESKPADTPKVRQFPGPGAA
jgi:hypothetical protein